MGTCRVQLLLLEHIYIYIYISKHLHQKIEKYNTNKKSRYVEEKLSIAISQRERGY